MTKKTIHVLTNDKKIIKIGYKALKNTPWRKYLSGSIFLEAHKSYLTYDLNSEWNMHLNNVIEEFPNIYGKNGSDSYIDGLFLTDIKISLGYSARYDEDYYKELYNVMPNNIRERMPMNIYIRNKKKYNRNKNILYYTLGLLYHNEIIPTNIIEGLLGRLLIMNKSIMGNSQKDVVQMFYFHSIYSGGKKYMAIVNTYIKNIFYQVKPELHTGIMRYFIKQYVNVDNGPLIPNDKILVHFIADIMKKFPLGPVSSHSRDIWKYAIEPLLFDWFIEWERKHSNRWNLLKGQIDTMVNIYQTKIDSTTISYHFCGDIDNGTGEYMSTDYDCDQSPYDNPEALIEKIYYLELTEEEKRYYAHLGRNGISNLYMCNLVEKLGTYKKIIDDESRPGFIDVLFEIWRNDKLCAWKLNKRT